MNKRQILVSIIVSIIILLLGAMAFQSLKKMKKSTVSNKKVAAEVKYVETANFTTEDISSTISIDGRLNAYEKINLSAEANGKLESISKNWREGSYFKKGELLFRVSSKDEQLNVYAQRSLLLTAITQIMPDLKFDYPDVFQKWKNYLDEYQIEQTTAPLPELSSQQEKYYLAGKNIFNLYYNIKSAEEQLKNHEIRAPFSGTFVMVNTYPGSLVSPGTSLATIMNTSKYELQTPISLSELQHISLGQKVQLSAPDLNQSYTGTINRIGRQIDQTTQSVPIFISVQGKGLKDGMYLDGVLQGSIIEDASILPLDAIVGSQSIYILQDSTVQKQDIDIILRTDKNIIVKGIKPEDKVITSGVNSLSPGQKAAIQKS